MKKTILALSALLLIFTFADAQKAKDTKKPAAPAKKEAPKEAEPVVEGGGGSDGQAMKWARIRYLGTGIGQGGAHDRWDINLDFDLMFLAELAKYTTIKPEMKVNTPTLEKIDEITQYPVLFMHCETNVRFTDIEITNMKEYCERGGLIFQDDCILEAKYDKFFQGFRKTIEEKVFPGKKMVQLTMENEIFHTVFDMPKGMPYLHGPMNGLWGLYDDKGRLMVLATSADLHCGWNNKDKWFGEKKTMEAYQMGINIVVYAMTH